MAITKAIGLGIAIVMLKILLPGVLSEIEHAVIALFRGATTSLEVVTNLTASVGTIELSQEPFELPQTMPARTTP